MKSVFVLALVLLTFPSRVEAKRRSPTYNPFATNYIPPAYLKPGAPEWRKNYPVGPAMTMRPSIYRR